MLKAIAIIKNGETLNTMQIPSLTARKRTVFKGLNRKLSAIIKDPEELEEKIMQAKDIECEINEKVRR